MFFSCLVSCGQSQSNKPLEWTGHQIHLRSATLSSLPATQGQRYADQAHGIISMEFNEANYEVIRQRYLERTEFEIQVRIQDTGYSADNVPAEWSPCQPSLLANEDLVRCLLYLGDEMHDRLTRLELVVHHTGGRLLYKSLGDSIVGIKVTWPNAM
jgi:hypothetical protein